VLHQKSTPVDHSAFDACGVRILGVPCPIQSRTELLRQPSPVGWAVVDVQDQVAQTEELEPPDHGVDRGTFLGYEQRPLTLAGQAHNQVGDGLALAGAGRTLDDEVRPPAHGIDHRLLGGVGVQDQVLPGRVGVGRKVRDGVADGLERPGVTGHRRDDIMVDQGAELGREVGDHRQLGVGECAQHQPRRDLELGDSRTHPD
jgi:hypothetical protein